MTVEKGLDQLQDLVSTPLEDSESEEATMDRQGMPLADCTK